MILSLTWEAEDLEAELVEQNWWDKFLLSIEKEDTDKQLNFEELKQLIQSIQVYQDPMVIAQPSGRQVHLDYFNQDA